MKTQNSGVYLELLNDWLSGKGMDLDNHHLTRADIEPMMSFYARILKSEIYVSVSQHIIGTLLDN